MEALGTVRHYIAVCDLKSNHWFGHPTSVQNTDLDIAWVCLPELNGNTSTENSACFWWVLYGKPRYLGVACTDDHRSFRGVLKKSLWALEETHVFFLSRWQISMVLMAEILHHLGWTRPCKQWDRPPPSISNLCFFCVFFRRCFWYLIWNVPRGSVPVFGPDGLGGGEDAHFFCEWWTLFSRVCAWLYLYTDDLNSKRWKLTKHWPNVCVCSSNWAHFSKCFTWFLAGKILRRLGQGDSREILLLWFAAACVKRRFLRSSRRYAAISLQWGDVGFHALEMFGSIWRVDDLS